MRLTIVSPTAYPVLVPGDYDVAGGAELQLALLGRTLRDRGHSIAFVVGDHGQPQRMERDGFEIVSAFQLYRGARKLRFVPDMLKLRAAIRGTKPDMVHQRATAFYTGQCCLFAHEAKAAFSFTTGLDANCYRDLQGRVPPVLRGLYRWGIRNADLVLAQTRHQSQLLKDNFDRHSELLPNMMELPADDGNQPDGPVVWVGSLSPRKRPERFLALARALPDVPFRMIGGGGDDAGATQALLRDATSVPNLEMVGFVAPDHMDDVYRGASLYVNTSLHEGFPNAFLQASSFRVPTASISIDPDGVIVDRGLGMVVGEDGDLTAAVRHLLASTDARDRMGAAARRYVEENHDVVAVAPRAEELLQRAVQARRGM